MEDKFLIDLSLKYGLESGKISKLANVIYQAGIKNMKSREFKNAANYICSMNLADKPAEELIEELKRKGYTSEGA